MKFAVCGYGRQFGMTKVHADALEATGRMKLAALCDTDPERVEAARKDFPGVEAYRGLSELLASSDAELVVIITPHNTHAPLAIEALNAGRHVIVEKPMCITTREAAAMIRAARANQRMLSVYHNRRWDGDYITLKQVVERGTIGRVFNVRCQMENYGMNETWWRSDKKVSGGTLHDWGSHMVDWVLGLVPSAPVAVTGFSQKLVWTKATIADEARALVRFEDGTIGDVLISHIRDSRSALKWEVMGTKGNILSYWNSRKLEVTTRRRGRTVTEYVPTAAADWAAYQKNIVAHLFRGAELAVTPESAARVISVLEAQDKSAAAGKTLPIPGV